MDVVDIAVGEQAVALFHPVFDCGHILTRQLAPAVGLDLAIALGILLESEQVSAEHFNYKEGFVYGALTLKGEVHVPHDLQLLNYDEVIPPVLTNYKKLLRRNVIGCLTAVYDVKTLGKNFIGEPGFQITIKNVDDKRADEALSKANKLELEQKFSSYYVSYPDFEISVNEADSDFSPTAGV